MPEAKVTIDLSKSKKRTSTPSGPLVIAAVKDGQIIAQKTVTPGKEKNPRRITAQLDLGKAEDGVAGAEIVVAPADDERNVHSSLAARKFVTAVGDRIAEASIVVNRQHLCLVAFLLVSQALPHHGPAAAARGRLRASHRRRTGGHSGR